MVRLLGEGLSRLGDFAHFVGTVLWNIGEELAD